MCCIDFCFHVFVVCALLYLYTLHYSRLFFFYTLTLLPLPNGEVRRVVGHRSKLSEKLINEMVYLKCVVKESLRLRVCPAMIARETCKAVKLEGLRYPSENKSVD